MFALKKLCIEAIKTYLTGKVSYEMTLLSNVMKIDSAVLLIYVSSHVIKLDCLRTDILLMYCGEVGSNKSGLFSQSVSKYSPATYCDELSISTGNLATVQHPMRTRLLLVAVNLGFSCPWDFS
jgi:hypothetical protein